MPKFQTSSGYTEKLVSEDTFMITTFFSLKCKPDPPKLLFNCVSQRGESNNVLSSNCRPATNSFLKVPVKDKVAWVLLKSTDLAQRRFTPRLMGIIYLEKNIKNLNTSKVRVSRAALCVLPEGLPPQHVYTCTHTPPCPPAVRDPFYRFKDSSLQEEKRRCQDTRCGSIQDHS